MKIQEALDFIKGLLDRSTRKSEFKFYNNFHKILASLKKREFTEEEIKTIELELESLDLTITSINQFKELKKKYTKFISFLETDFSLITPGHYTNSSMIYGMIFGSGIGTALGTAFGGNGTAIGISLGTSLGMLLGIVYGTTKDNEAKKQNRVLI